MIDFFFPCHRIPYGAGNSSSTKDYSSWHTLPLKASRVDSQAKEGAEWLPRFGDFNDFAQDLGLLIDFRSKLNPDSRDKIAEADEVIEQAAAYIHKELLDVLAKELPTSAVRVAECLKELVNYWMVAKEERLGEYLDEIKSLFLKCNLSHIRAYTSFLDEEDASLFEGTCFSLSSIIEDVLADPEGRRVIALDARWTHETCEEQIVQAIGQRVGSLSEDASTLIKFLSSPMPWIRASAFKAIRKFPLEGVHTLSKRFFFEEVFRDDSLEWYYPLLGAHYLKQGERQGITWVISKLLKSGRSDDASKLFHEAIASENNVPGKDFIADTVKMAQLLMHLEEVEYFFILEDWFLDAVYKNLLKLDLPFVQKANYLAAALNAYDHIERPLPESLKEDILNLSAETEDQAHLSSYMQHVYDAICPSFSEYKHLAAKRALIKMGERFPGLKAMPDLVYNKTGDIFSASRMKHHSSEVPAAHILLDCFDVGEFPSHRYQLSSSGELYVSTRSQKLYICEAETGLAIDAFRSVDWLSNAYFSQDQRSVYVKVKEGFLAKLGTNQGLQVFSSCHLGKQSLGFVGEAAADCLFVCSGEYDLWGSFDECQIDLLDPSTQTLRAQTFCEDVKDFTVAAGHLNFIQRVSKQGVDTFTLRLMRMDASGSLKEPLLSLSFSRDVAFRVNLDYEVHGNRLYYLLSDASTNVRALGAYDLTTGEVLGAPVTLEGGSIRSMDISPDGRLLALADRSSLTVIALDGDEPAVLWSISLEGSTLFFSPDSKWIYALAVSAKDSEYVPAYKVDSQTGSKAIFPTEGQDIKSLVGVLPDGRPVFSGYAKGEE